MRSAHSVLLGLLVLASASAHAIEADADRLAACAACHGVAGEGQAGNEYYPHLAGKPSGYLLAQLKAFRDGRRVYPQMTWLMRNMGDDYLAAIADYYAALPPRSSAQVVPMKPADEARARELIEEGDAGRGVPACAACHGRDLAGQAPGVPALLGLPPDYVVAQLGAWRTGARSTRGHDCMADIAKALVVTDLRRLGDWLASQGAAHSLAPAAAGSFALPRRCADMPVAEHVP